MRKPNFVFILIDDMGWTDLGCYGSSFYETPNIDRLAASGMRFTDAYAACPVCSPTRASILTGRYPASVGVTNFIDWSGKSHPAKGKLIDVPYLRHLPLENHTIASALKDGGYDTWHVGKWHLGGPEYYPDKQGFDVNIGGWEQGHPHQGYFSPWGIDTLVDGPDGEYLTDRLTDEAIDLIRENKDKPFYLNLWYYTVHTPIQAKQDKIEKYRTKAASMGLDTVDTFAEGDYFPSDHKKDQRIKRRLVQSDPVYAAMIESLDENVGRLLDVLEETGLTDDTVVIFFSDNGGLATSEGSPTCNAPLAEGKGWMYEGGTREPLIVKWPGHIGGGTISDTPVTSTDFYPTMLEMAGLDPIPEQHADGESLLTVLEETGTVDRGCIFWHYPHYGNQGGTPGSSVRCGAYKLIEFYEDGRLELYNLKEDLNESMNLAEQEPATTARLKERLDRWRIDIEAKIPAPNPDYGKA
ncbi:MAG: sulfatase [Candidatus Latescibacteria bacterium]|nr:sulfatase [Candidatus Latescibacterota bacterium]